MSRGKAKTLAMNHKSSRVLQSILKYGTDAQKKAVIAEVIPSLVRARSRAEHNSLSVRVATPQNTPQTPAPHCSFLRRPCDTPSTFQAPSHRVSPLLRLTPLSPQVELAKDTYGTHLARKIVDGAAKQQLPDMLKAVKGHCVQLARHPHGAPVLDALYVRLPSAKRTAVLSEFYGKEFLLLLMQERSTGAGRGAGRHEKALQRQVAAVCCCDQRSVSRLHFRLHGRQRQGFPVRSPRTSGTLENAPPESRTDPLLLPALASPGATGKPKQRSLSLGDAIAENPGRKRPILQHVEITIGPILEKGLVSYNYVHRILADFLAITGPSGAADIAQSVTGAALLRMIHTTDGVRAGSALLGASTAKERKAMLKAVKARGGYYKFLGLSLGVRGLRNARWFSLSFCLLAVITECEIFSFVSVSICPRVQGRVLDISKDECGHVILLAALECVDDTQLLGKAILGELLPHLAEVACHRYARRLLLNILSPRNPRYLPEAVIEALPKVAEMGSGAGAGAAGGGGYESEDEDGEGNENDGGDESDGAGDDDDFVTRKGSAKAAAASNDGDNGDEEMEEEGGEEEDEEGGAKGKKAAPVPASKKPAPVRFPLSPLVCSLPPRSPPASLPLAAERLPRICF